MIKEFKGEYAFLSNFYHSPLNVYTNIGGITYNTVEHYYQAHKAIYVIDHIKIVLAPTPNMAKKIGRKISIWNDWDGIHKELVMEEGLCKKFNLNKELRRKLLKTGDEELQEGNWWGDTYWGVDLKTGKGLNRLGKLLMTLREDLR